MFNQPEAVVRPMGPYWHGALPTIHYGLWNLELTLVCLYREIGQLLVTLWPSSTSRICAAWVREAVVAVTRIQMPFAVASEADSPT